MGFFDKIKKAFMNEKDTQSTEASTTEEQQSTDQEEPSVQPTTAQAESPADSHHESTEEVFATSDVVEPMTESETVDRSSVEESDKSEEPEKPEEPEELEVVATVTVEEESQEELVVQEKYEKGLAKTRKTFGERLNELFANFRSVDEDFFEELEETLIGADVGFETSLQITESLRQEVKLRNVKKPAAIQNTIIEKMVDLYEAEGIGENNALNIQSNGLTVMLFVGVNGVGKTTSIGKLAYEYKKAGKKVLLAAADTFRAGAIDQLVVWGERAGVEVVRGNAGGDPAAVVFDAVERAKQEQADILLVDTAGRLQNKVNLMKELEKIKRVIQRELPDAPHEVLLVVDATTGQNAMSQAKQFKETTDVTGLVLTKLDGTAKGGIVLAIRNELHLPVKLVGLGEGIDDLEPFDANDFALGLFKGLLKEEN